MLVAHFELRSWSRQGHKGTWSHEQPPRCSELPEGLSAHSRLQKWTRLSSHSLSSVLLNFRLTTSAQKIKLNLKKLLADREDGGGPRAQPPKGNSEKSTPYWFITEALSNQRIPNPRVVWFNHCWERWWLSLNSTSAMQIRRRNDAWTATLGFQSPQTLKFLQFMTPLPNYFSKLLKKQWAKGCHALSTKWFTGKPLMVKMLCFTFKILGAWKKPKNVQMQK